MTVYEDREIVLEGHQIFKSFPGVTALKGVDFAVEKGEVHAIVGENGAGKSTLMKIIIGAEKLDAGELILEGKKISFSSPREAQFHGINMVHQELSLVDSLTVGENIFIGSLPIKGKTMIVNWRKLYNDSLKILKKLKISIDVRKKVKELSMAERQIVEVAKATSRKINILILDEPTSALTESEKKVLFELINTLKEQRISIIYISHRLEEIFEIADKATILRNGEKIGTYPINELDMSRIIELVIGREISKSRHEVFGNIDRGRKIFSVKNLSKKNINEDISFDLFANEIVGFTGLLGSGCFTLGEIIFGVQKYDSGEIFVDGKKLHVGNLESAIDAGMGYLPLSRDESLFYAMSVADNITLVNMDNITKFGVVQNKRENEIAKKFIQQLNIKTTSLKQKVGFLSGGNKQKTAFAKWICKECKVLILNEPTKGIDVGAKEEMCKLIWNLAKNQHIGIIIISTEVDLLLRLCSRFIVLFKGRINAEFTRDTVSQEKLLHSSNKKVI